ncbi:hypothetical protein O181_080759 [Austropuccinia psidii MF-1]|uniref:Uncharacterized protein n=1 Tax=Austropuccinia psidii MF-1 TaxID=1389203 RepID=A0A9Q3IJG9_9BASI|nr:hypothetical protein [Austropuccinia psidii MF-1]
MQTLICPFTPQEQPEDRQGLFRTRNVGYGHHSGWKDTEGNCTHNAINLGIQQNSHTRGLEIYGSSSSAPQTPQRFIPMEHGQQQFQPSFTLRRTWRRLSEDMSQRDTLQRPYGNHQRM